MSIPPPVPRTRSFRLRLLLASVLIEAIMLTLLVGNGVRLIDEHLRRNTQVRVEFQEASYNITLAGILASRDYSTLQSVLDGWGANNNVTYMVVTDTTGRVVGTIGQPTGTALPPPDEEISPTAKIYHGDFDVIFLGQPYGHVRYGMDTTFLGEARNQLMQQSVVISAIEIALTASLLAAIGFWLTRHLDLLARASLKVARGDFSQHLEVSGHDEISVLTQAFNTMSDAVQSRIAQLEESQQRFRAIADYTYAWENWFGTDGRLRWVNPAVERIVGYSPVECYAMANFPLPLIHADDVATVRRHFAAAQVGESGKDVEFRVVRRDGTILWVAMSWQAIFSQDRQALGFRASLYDVTERKYSVDMMLETKNELERLLYAASHDLQEPVRLVLTYSQMLERQVEGALASDGQDSLKIIRDSARQLQLLVKGLMDFSHSGRPRANFVSIDCRTIIDTAIAECGPAAAEATFDIGELPTAFGDPSLLLIVFENIISNAIKFHRPGIAPLVRISSEPEEDGWRIDIADNGIGIEQADLQTIIRPFSRVYSRSAFPGAGLGLAAATKVIALHGGRLWLESDPSQGTTVHIWLPAFSS
jgi:PAS domain S-box-containing protein